MNTFKNCVVAFLICNPLISQFRLAPNGHVAIGTNWPNHSMHVWGYSQIFNYNQKEIRFVPRMVTDESMISSNLGKIIFWHNDWGWNTLKAGAYIYSVSYINEMIISKTFIIQR